VSIESGNDGPEEVDESTQAARSGLNELAIHRGVTGAMCLVLFIFAELVLSGFARPERDRNATRSPAGLCRADSSPGAFQEIRAVTRSPTLWRSDSLTSSKARTNKGGLAFGAP
jgi:hypothetical protein